jgi:hypothetical protein
MASYVSVSTQTTTFRNSGTNQDPLLTPIMLEGYQTHEILPNIDSKTIDGCHTSRLNDPMKVEGNQDHEMILLIMRSFWL